jgi:hypothetical protein
MPQMRGADHANEPRRLGLEVRFDAEPIQGRLYDQTDQGCLNRAFSGWLDLMSAIEAARPDAPTQTQEAD